MVIFDITRHRSIRMIRAISDVVDEGTLAKAELKKLIPEDAREASGHGLKAKRSKYGAISFESLEPAEAVHATHQ